MNALVAKHERVFHGSYIGMLKSRDGRTRSLRSTSASSTDPIAGCYMTEERARCLARARPALGPIAGCCSLETEECARRLARARPELGPI